MCRIKKPRLVWMLLMAFIPAVAAAEDPPAEPVSISGLLPAGTATAPGQVSATVSGTISRPDGKVVSDAVVTLVELQRSSTADEEGRFHFASVPPGRYHLQAVSRQFGSAVEEIEVAHDAIDLGIVLRIETHGESIVVSAGGLGRGSTESYLPVNTLDATELIELMEPTLGDTLRNEVGVNSTSYAPGASRPVIRGQTAARVRVLEGGIGVGDVSSISPDHAVASDPMVAERVEIIRGAATLLYGSSAVGGVVNILDNRVPMSMPQSAITGTLILRGGSVARERSGALLLDGGSGEFAWHVDAMGRQTDDFSIPGPAVDGASGNADGTLANSDVESTGATVGASWVKESNFVGVSFRGFTTNYGIPAELELADPNSPETGDIRIDMEQRRADIRGNLDVDFGIFDGLSFSLGTSDYEHMELEGTEVGTTFTSRHQELRAELPYLQGKRHSGSLGMQLVNREVEAVGEEAFIAPSTTRGAALFGLHRMDFKPVRYELGGRLEFQDLQPETPTGLPDRDFAALSLSAGALWQADGKNSLGGSMTRAVRIPNTEELYSDGSHLATLSYEIGDPFLDEEIALGLDVIYRHEAARFSGSVNVFHIDYTSYIYERPTGAVLDDLPVYQFTQQDAAFSGFEMDLLFGLLERGGHDFDMQVISDYVRGELDDGSYVPFLPPWRATLRFHYRGPRWHASAGAAYYAEQSRVAEFETITDGYILVDASVGYRLVAGGTVMEFLLRGTNLTDQLARNSISRVKDLVPLPGRNISLTYRLIF